LEGWLLINWEVGFETVYHLKDAIKQNGFQFGFTGAIVDYESRMVTDAANAGGQARHIEADYRGKCGHGCAVRGYRLARNRVQPASVDLDRPVRIIAQELLERPIEEGGDLLARFSLTVTS
jgi:hypothetical protein